MTKSQIPILILVLLATAASATTLERGISSAILAENEPRLEEIYRLRIENKRGGSITVSEDGGEEWEEVGSVLYPTTMVNSNGYSASKWMEPGKVVATSVNAIHVKAGSLTEESRTIFSILTREMLMPPFRYRSYLSPNSSIYTDVPAGKSIFGGGYSPYVGNTVMVSRQNQSALPISEEFVPAVDDVYYIVVEQPADLPREIVFENRFGGKITISYYNGEEKLIGEVLRPVSGIGRFEGTKYVGPGRIRANHAGVIDVSLSPLGSLAGFQIVPSLHGMELTYVKKMTQWMVIGPARADDPSIEGRAPFYKYFIQPNYAVDDLESENWEERLLSRYLVEIKYAGEEEWEPMPIYSMYRSFRLPTWTNSVFDKVSHFRILFPVK